MFCPNKINNTAVTGMRLEILQQKRHIQHYKKLYQAECKIVNRLQKKILGVNAHNTFLQEEVHRLKNKLLPDYSSKEPKNTKTTKQWDQIKCDHTRRRKIGLFRNHILQSIQSLKICHRAEVSLWLEQNRIHFSFSPSDITAKPQDTEMLSATSLKIVSDHTYAAHENKLPEEDKYCDLDYSEIFDSSGGWRKLHVRKLIYVMDCFRISHEAYHELRMVSKGHLPPINYLAKEKKIMSEEIPYEKHAKVGDYLL